MPDWLSCKPITNITAPVADSEGNVWYATNTIRNNLQKLIHKQKTLDLSSGKVSVTSSKSLRKRDIKRNYKLNSKQSNKNIDLVAVRKESTKKIVEFLEAHKHKLATIR